MQKNKCFFACFGIDAKPRNLKLQVLFSHVFASEGNQKLNEAKTRRKKSKNFKATKDKVKFWDNMYRNKEKY